MLADSTSSPVTGGAAAASVDTIGVLLENRLIMAAEVVLVESSSTGDPYGAAPGSLIESPIAHAREHDSIRKIGCFP